MSYGIRMTREVSWFHACVTVNAEGRITGVLDNCQAMHGLRCTAQLARDAGGDVFKRWIARRGREQSA